MTTETSKTVATSTRLKENGGHGSSGLCPMERSLGVVGTRSAMMLVREAFYGSRRFDDLARRAGITESVAAKRLRELVEHGIFERVPYRETGQRTRHEYVLTESGLELFPIIAALLRWGRQHVPDPRGTVQWTHEGCGAQVETRVHCTEGHEIGADEVWASFDGGTTPAPDVRAGV